MNDCNYLIHKPKLKNQEELNQLIENQTLYSFNNCEFSIYETHANCVNYRLPFNHLGFTSMLQGKKSLKIEDKTSYFEYHTGQSLIVAPGETLIVDFLEAEETPTQCISITLNPEFISSTLGELNHHFAKVDENSSWNIHLEDYYLFNTPSLASATHNMMRIALDNNIQKDIMADFALKELLVRLMQTQARKMVEKNFYVPNTRIGFIVDYIRRNLHQKISIETMAQHAYVSKTNFFKMFKEELGTSPNNFILQERISKAKELLLHNYSIKETAYQTGFSDTNYFTKVFKQMVGTTPKVFQKNAIKNP